MERRVPAARHAAGDRAQARSRRAEGAGRSGGARTHPGARLHREGAGSDEFRARIDGDIKIYSDVAKAANLKFEQ